MSKIKVHKFLTDSKIGGFCLTLLILASVAIFALETEYTSSLFLRAISVSIAVVFMFEYALRIWIADKDNGRWAYISSPYGIIDLLAFLPALLFPFLSGSVVLRLLRLARLAQLLKIPALKRSVKRIMFALKETWQELIITLCIALGLIFIGAVLMYFAEAHVQPENFGSIPRALWWSIATLTTVGYGDVYPVTALGKVIAAILAIIGIAAVAMPAGIFAAAFTSYPSKE